MRTKNLNIETTYQKVVKLYNSNITDSYTLAQKLGAKKSTILTYISRARKNGDIEKNIIYKRIVEAYNSGITKSSDISKKNGISVATVYKYIKLAKEQGLISPKEYKNPKVKKQPDKQEKGEIGKKEGTDVDYKKTFEDLRKRQILEQNIRKELIQSIYPREVAKTLRIKTWQVYKYIENLSGEEAKKLKQDRLKNNPLYSIIVSRKNEIKLQSGEKNGVVGKILCDMEKSLVEYKSRINLARIYFILGNGKEGEKILNIMLHDNSYSKSIRDIVKREFDKAQMENIIMEMRYKYKKSHNMDGTRISYSDLCTKYNIRTGEVIDALGMENSEPER